MHLEYKRIRDICLRRFDELCNMYLKKRGKLKIGFNYRKYFTSLARYYVKKEKIIINVVPLLYESSDFIKTIVEHEFGHHIENLLFYQITNVDNVNIDMQIRNTYSLVKIDISEAIAEYFVALQDKRYRTEKYILGDLHLITEKPEVVFNNALKKGKNAWYALWQKTNDKKDLIIVDANAFKFLKEDIIKKMLKDVNYVIMDKNLKIEDYFN